MFANELKKILAKRAEKAARKLNVNDYDFTGVKEILRERVDIDAGSMYISLVKSQYCEDYQKLETLFSQVEDFSTEQLTKLFSAWAESEGLQLLTVKRSTSHNGWFISFILP